MSAATAANGRTSKAAWLARREERRQRQREENVARAAKMHSARIAAEAGREAEKSRLVALRRRILVGCSGWFYWHWRGSFYPTELPTGGWFRHYASHFRTVELNAPFYSWPTVGAVKAWARQAAGRQFIYTVKVSELITHLKRFSRTRTLIQDFYYIADLLGARMGCFLFQLPPSFHFTPRRLEQIVSQLDSRHRNVVEFRHRTWWNERVYSAFREHGIIFCSCSGPRLPDALVKTAADVYVRFHGTTRWYRHNYTAQELDAWAAVLKECGAARVWAYFNNDRNGYALKNARMLWRRLASEG